MDAKTAFAYVCSFGALALLLKAAWNWWEDVGAAAENVADIIEEDRRSLELTAPEE